MHGQAKHKRSHSRITPETMITIRVIWRFASMTMEMFSTNERPSGTMQMLRTHQRLSKHQSP